MTHSPDTPATPEGDAISRAAGSVLMRDGRGYVEFDHQTQYISDVRGGPGAGIYGDAIPADCAQWITHNPGDLRSDRVNVICPDADVVILANIEVDVANLIVAEHNAALRSLPPAQPVAQEPVASAPERIWAWAMDTTDRDGRPHTETAWEDSAHDRVWYAERGIDLAEYVRADLAHPATPAPVEAGQMAVIREAYEAAWAMDEAFFVYEDSQQSAAADRLRHALSALRDAIPEVDTAQSAPVGGEPVTVGLDLASGPDQTAVTLINPTKAVLDVLAERQRQISAEGWTPEHDDRHQRAELAKAAVCYALNCFVGPIGPGSDDFTAFWPWLDEWWKPTTPRRDLVKAGALILAEIERRDRAAPVGGEVKG